MTLALLAVLALSSGAWAQLPNTPSETLYALNSEPQALARAQAGALSMEMSAWQTFKSRSEASLYTSLAGPSLGGANPAVSYNPFVGDRWPVQMFSALYYGYRVARDWTLGVELSGVWNTTSVETSFGNRIEPGIALFNPAFQLRTANLVDTGWFNLSQMVQVFLPFTDFTRIQQTMLFSVTLDHTFTFRPVDRRWLFGFTTRLQPTFYSQPAPRSWNEPWRNTFYLSAGHFLNFQLSPQFTLATETLFDAAHWGGSQHWYDFSDFNDDRWRATLRYSPGVPVFSNVGVFLQGLIFKPSLEATIVGADLTLRL